MSDEPIADGLTQSEDLQAGQPDHGPNDLQLSESMSDEEYTAGLKSVQATRMANARLLRELSQLGINPEFTVSMLAIYFQGLVDVGLLTKAQLVTIEKSWEEKFYKQLEAMLASGKEAIAQAQARAQLLVPTAQVDPNRAARRTAQKQGLILPGPGGS